MKSPVSASRWPRRTPCLFPNEWRVSWQNLDKDSPPSDPYPTGRHTRPPREGQEMEARPWGSYSSICCHGHASVSVPVISVFNQTVSTVRHLSWTSGTTGFLLTKQTYTQKPAFLNFRSGGGGGSVQLQKVVWEVCFCTYMCHVVLSSGLRGIIPLRNLLAPSWPASSAICCHEALSHRPPGPSWASTGLLKFGCHEDKRERRCSSAICVLSSYHASMETLSGWGCSVYAVRSIYSYMLRSKSQFRPDRRSLQVLAAHGHHLIMYGWLGLLQTGFDCIKSLWVLKHCSLNYCLKTSNHLDSIDLRSLWTCEILKQWEQKRSKSSLEEEEKKKNKVCYRSAIEPCKWFIVRLLWSIKSSKLSV